MKKPIIGNTVGTNYKSVPRMSVLDKKEKWLAEPQEIYPRVYGESAASKELDNKLFITGDAEAPKDPISKFVFANGLYYNSRSELPNVKIGAYNSYSDTVSDVLTVIDGDTSIIVQKSEELAGDPTLRIWSNQALLGNLKEKKAVVEFDFRVNSSPVFRDGNPSWFIRLSFEYDKTKVWKTSGAGQVHMCYTQTENGEPIVTLNKYPTNEHYKIGKIGEWCNLRFVQLGEDIHCYINDVLCFTEKTDPTYTSRVFDTFNGLSVYFRSYASGYSTQFANIFCGTVLEDRIYSGRYLDSVAGRRKNRHILVPKKLSDYVDYGIDGLSADEYALSYGAAKEMIGDQYPIPITLGGTGATTAALARAKLGAAASNHSHRAATTTSLGFVKSGGDIRVSDDGEVSVMSAAEASSLALSTRKILRCEAETTTFLFKKGKSYHIVGHIGEIVSGVYESALIFIPEDMEVGKSVFSTRTYSGGSFRILYNGDNTESRLYYYGEGGGAITTVNVTIREI